MSKELSKATLYQYETQISNLKNNGIDVTKCSYDEICKFFQKNNYAYSTISGYITTILHSLKEVNTPDIIELKKQLIEQSKKIKIVLANKNICKELTDKEQKNFVTWETIVKIQKKMKEFCESTDDISLYTDYVLVSLYVLHPPRRVKDYAQLYMNDEVNINLKEIINVDKIFDNEYAEKFKWMSQKVYNVDLDAKKKNEVQLDKDDESDDDNDDTEESDNEESNNEKMDKKNSFVTLNDQKFFVFENFKTQKRYGKQVLQINYELGKIIERYCVLKKIKNGDRIFAPKEYSTQNKKINQNTFFVERLRTIFQNMIEKNISASSLRHIYLINFIKTDVSPFVKSLVSLCMAHSMEQQDKYAKIGKITNMTDFQIKKNVCEYYEKKDKFELYSYGGHEDKLLNAKLFEYVLSALGRNVTENKQVGYIYGISSRNKLLYVGSTIKSIEDRFIEHKTTNINCPDIFHKFLTQNVESCAVSEIMAVNVSSRFELTLYEDYCIYINNTIENGMNVKLNNALSILLCSNGNYDKKIAEIKETVASYIKERKEYCKFLDENVLSLKLLTDIDFIDNKKWIKINGHFEYIGENLIYSYMSQMQPNKKCKIHNKSLIKNYHDCICNNAQKKSSSIIKRMWGIYCLHSTNKYIIFTRKGGIQNLFGENVYFENIQLVKFLMENGMKNCHFRPLGYFSFDSDEIYAVDYLNTLKMQKGTHMREYLQNGFAISDIITNMNYLALGNRYNLYNCSSSTFEFIIRSMNLQQQHKLKIMQKKMAEIEKINLEDSNEQKPIVLPDKQIPIIPIVVEKKVNIQDKISNSDNGDFVCNNDIDTTIAKSGRPSKYKTAEEKHKARLAAKQKWYREKGKESVKLYNAKYYHKE
jgi:hypothetical protein